jgi:hypothetical protein
MSSYEFIKSQRLHVQFLTRWVVCVQAFLPNVSILSVSGSFPNHNLEVSQNTVTPNHPFQNWIFHLGYPYFRKPRFKNVWINTPPFKIQKMPPVQPASDIGSNFLTAFRSRRRLAGYHPCPKNCLEILLVGDWPTPLKNMSMGRIIFHIWNGKNVWNHQPV